MFKKAEKEQLDIFRDVSVHLSSKAIKELDSKTAWNNVFYNQFTSKVDDRIYAPLYFDNNGRPNASIPIMLGMMLIKEMQGWSDEQLFEQCMFNIQVKCALGLRHLDSNTPGPSTYYLFRKKVAEHLEITGEDLIEQTFAQVCSEQMQALQISGSKIRMDSKLIQSNIARQNRLQLIIEAVRVSIKGVEIMPLKDQLSDKHYKIIDELQQKSTSNITYHLSKKEKEDMLQGFGSIIQALINAGMVSQESILHRIYTEQYTVVEDSGEDQNTSVPSPKDAKEVSSASVQSVHDPEAAYRKKGEGDSVQRVKGYH